MSKSISLGELANLLEGELCGDPNKVVSGIASLSSASEQDLSFYHNKKYKQDLGETKAGAVLVGVGVEHHGDHILCSKPQTAYAKAMQFFNPPNWPKAFVSPQSFIADTAIIQEAK